MIKLEEDGRAFCSQCFEYFMTLFGSLIKVGQILQGLKKTVQALLLEDVALSESRLI